MNDAGVLRIVRIDVRYEIRVPAGRREDAERALAAHVDHCPVARTLMPCVEVSWDAEIEEMESGGEQGAVP